MKLNILYVYGFNSNANSSTFKSIKERLSKYKDIHVQCVDYPQVDPFKSVNFLNDYIRHQHINLVIGSSLGGFITLNLNAPYRIVCNPALLAGDDIKGLGARVEMVNKYNQLRDEGIWKKHYSSSKLTKGLFGTHDELFRHKDIFDKVFPNASKYVETAHHYTDENVKDYLIPEILTIYQNEEL